MTVIEVLISVSIKNEKFQNLFFAIHKTKGGSHLNYFVTLILSRPQGARKPGRYKTISIKLLRTHGPPLVWQQSVFGKLW